MAYAIKVDSVRNDFNVRAEKNKKEAKEFANYISELIARNKEKDPDDDVILYKVPLAYLSLEKYQRDPKASKVGSIQNNFDSKKVGAITVSIRDNKLYVVDGMHRCAVFDALHKQEIPAVIFDGLKLEEEAGLFSGQDQNKSRVNNTAKFNADVIAKKEDAVAIKRLCDERNLTIKFIPSAKKNTYLTKNNINSIKILRDVYKLNGEESVKVVLDLIIDAGWNKFDFGFKSDCLIIGRTLCEIGHNNGVHTVKGDDNYNTILRSMKMFSEGPDKWIGIAHSSYPGALGQHGEGSIVKYVKALCGVID